MASPSVTGGSLKPVPPQPYNKRQAAISGHAWRDAIMVRNLPKHGSFAAGCN
jgi:hypothetical protein